MPPTSCAHHLPFSTVRRNCFYPNPAVPKSIKQLSCIFARFYSAALSSNGDAHSGGLGLAIAQAIAGAQGGSIECRSVLGAGSTFTVTLPVANSMKGSTGTPPKQKLMLS